MTNDTTRRLLGFAVLVLAALFGLGIQTIDGQGGYAGLSARFLPTVVTTGLALCGLGLLMSRTGGVAPDAARPLPHSAGALQGFLWVLGGLLVHAGLIGVLGFPVASALLMCMVARGFGSRQWLRNFLTGLALTIPVWLLFTRVLDIHLPFFPLLK